MTIEKLLASKKFVLVLSIVGAVLFTVLIFSAGVEVGFRKASFGYRWGENYHRNFGGPREGFFGGSPMGMMPQNPHGAFGKVLTIEASTLILEGTDGVEKNILTDKDTTFHRMRETVTLADIHMNDAIVVVGEPNNQGQIVAKLIRIFPSPQSTSTPVK